MAYKLMAHAKLLDGVEHSVLWLIEHDGKNLLDSSYDITGDLYIDEEKFNEICQRYNGIRDDSTCMFLYRDYAEHVIRELEPYIVMKNFIGDGLDRRRL